MADIISSVLVQLSREQAQVRYAITDNDDSITKVICTNAKSYISDEEIVDSTVNYRGYVLFQIIYQNADGDIKSLDYTVEFKGSTNVDLAGADVTPIVSSSVQEVTFDGKNISATVDIMIDGISSRTYDVLTEISDDNVFVESTSVPYSQYIGRAQDKFEVENNIEINDDVAQVLSVCQNVALVDVKTDADLITVSYTLYVDVMYETTSNMVRSVNNSYELTREIMYEGTTENSDVISKIAIAVDDTTVNTMLGDITNVELITKIDYIGEVLNKKEIEGISDAYSTTNYSSIEYSAMPFVNSVGAVTLDDKITGSIEVNDTDSFVDEVLGTCCHNVVITRVDMADDTLTVEGVANTSVLYFTKETNAITSVDVAMPFQTQTMLNDNANALVRANVTMSDLNVRCRRGKDIEVTGTIDVYAEIAYEDSVTYTSNFEIGNVKPDDECVLSIYIVKEGDTIWSIAKHLGVSQEMLLEQNPNIELPLISGTKMVVFRPRLLDLN